MTPLHGHKLGLPPFSKAIFMGRLARQNRLYQSIRIPQMLSASKEPVWCFPVGEKRGEKRSRRPLGSLRGTSVARRDSRILRCHNTWTETMKVPPEPQSKE